jgi:hypothetical protein
MKAKHYATPKPFLHTLLSDFVYQNGGTRFSLPAGHVVDITEKNEKNAHYIVIAKGGAAFKIPSEIVTVNEKQ